MVSGCRWNYFERREQLTEAMEANEAFNRALRTWARWVDGSVDPAKTTVFFRSVSPEHKRCVLRDPQLLSSLLLHIFCVHHITSVEHKKCLL